MNTHYTIQPQGTRSFEAHGYGTIRCLTGQCWVTRTGDYRDYLLTAGDKHVTAANERLIVQALGNASIETTGALVQSHSYRLERIATGLMLAMHRMTAWLVSRRSSQKRWNTRSSSR